MTARLVRLRGDDEPTDAWDGGIAYDVFLGETRIGMVVRPRNRHDSAYTSTYYPWWARSAHRRRRSDGRSGPNREHFETRRDALAWLVAEHALAQFAPCGCMPEPDGSVPEHSADCREHVA